MGSPRPTMPALVWTFRNNHRGLTRNVSSFVTLSGSLREIGALLPTFCSAASADRERAVHPKPANKLAMAVRRLTVNRFRTVLVCIPHLSTGHSDAPHLAK